MQLPHGNKAILGNKIESYCLNIYHEKGKHKAILFDAKLGITIDNAYILKEALLSAAIREKVKIVKENDYGIHYNMKFILQTNVGESLILVGWIIRRGETFPRLTNCYPVKK
ncbi:hypothetical protein IQ215_11840 [Cyanobacterium stanieri LEGE 03274]|uniref:DUF6883 domain-containing protein n=1 Tax=Cyanobacterium stanieri LEGE 03274 TaxID=1828756 RepID=A0ABR9V787_9CHRO|nr:DUF6883 domain-containing protein [Cyanobacterium stanieri]MBE9223389.1 hypothetical protein [Cyanobacterium stanieri LEGE 03274]